MNVIDPPIARPPLVLGTRCGKCRCRDKRPECVCSCHQYWCDCHGSRRGDCQTAVARTVAAAESA